MPDGVTAHSSSAQRWHLSLTCRILFFILRTHHAQLLASRGLRDLLIELRDHLREAMHEQKDTIGYNLAALHFLKRQHDSKKTAEFYEQDKTGELTEEEVRAKLAQGAKKRKRAIIK
jgi:U3 small nucleolar RNA-associated protein 12